jgi:hypothetical protein
MRRKSQEDLAARIRLGQRPKQRQSAARRKGRTTSNPTSEASYDFASNFFLDPRPFQKIAGAAKRGEKVDSDTKADAIAEGIVTAGAAAVPFAAPAIKTGGKKVMKPLVKKALKFFGGTPKKKTKKLTKEEKIRAENKAAQAGTGTKQFEKFRPKVAKPAALKATPKAKAKTPKSKTPNTSTSPTSAPRPKPDPSKPKPRARAKPKPKTPNTSTSPTSAPRPKNTGVGQQKPRATPKAKATPKPKAKTGLSPRARKGITGGLAAAAIGAGTLSQSEKKAKPAPGSQAGSSGQSVNPSPGGYQADPTSAPKITSKKPDKQPDDGYRFYGKKGTGLGDTSRKYGIQYATQKQFDKDFDDSDGEKAGGRPGRGKMKSQGMNRSKRSGFSGRGSGAALRGF